MGEPRFTKGPWRWFGGRLVRSLIDDTYEPVVYGGKFSVQFSRKENAHLIAAAPDLYEALSNLFEVALEQGVDADVELHAAASALAKARGEHQEG